MCTTRLTAIMRASFINGSKNMFSRRLGARLGSSTPSYPWRWSRTSSLLCLFWRMWHWNTEHNIHHHRPTWTSPLDNSLNFFEKLRRRLMKRSPRYLSTASWTKNSAPPTTKTCSMPREATTSAYRIWWCNIRKKSLMSWTISTKLSRKRSILISSRWSHQVFSFPSSTRIHQSRDHFLAHLGARTHRTSCLTQATCKKSSLKDPKSSAPWDK